ncbi:hypothetical protein EVAR_50228_1 [Eumeta japonica]|uniref:Uncharacterized protein n=1 Tax=Eumeta variegata TaxID=151549 RepID=A0A4C2A436_EUMVA|nr:hypothetical protein EVAR_50228_1 [Eumeta japonica]
MLAHCASEQSATRLTKGRQRTKSLGLRVSMDGDDHCLSGGLHTRLLLENERGRRSPQPLARRQAAITKNNPAACCMPEFPAGLQGTVSLKSVAVARDRTECTKCRATAACRRLCHCALAVD